MDTTRFAAWRVALYQTFTRGTDTLMNTLDALLVATSVHHAIELTLMFPFARRWSSFYQDLQRGHIQRRALRQAYVDFLPYTPGTRLVLAVDPCSIRRPLAATARDRMAVHAPTESAGTAPVGLGWQFAALAVVPDPPSSWSYYLDCTRIRSGTTAARMAALQLSSVLPALPARPVVLGDRYFGSATFVLGTKTLACDKLLRIQTHRVFYRPPPVPDPHRRGRRPQKGARFQPKDPTTHGPPTAQWSGDDARGRAVTVTAWADLAFKEDPGYRLTLLQCARQDGPATKRDPRVIWLLWASPDPAPLADAPDLYTRRFSIDHGFRFDKQAFRWEDLRVRTPAQFQRWTDLLTAAHNTLGVARSLGVDARLPWERTPHRPMTPQHVRRALPGILAKLGTPAALPQPRGKSPGRRRGTVVRPAKRYPIVVKGRPPTAHAPPVVP